MVAYTVDAAVLAPRIPKALRYRLLTSQHGAAVFHTTANRTPDEARGITTTTPIPLHTQAMRVPGLTEPAPAVGQEKELTSFFHDDLSDLRQLRSDAASATHAFPAACRERGVAFSFGFPVDFRTKDLVDGISDGCWHPAIDTDNDIRDGAWITEATSNINLSAWPADARVILRKERAHPGAQLTFTDADGTRFTALLTDTPPRVAGGNTAGLELRHRQHARLEDRIRQAKATGLRNLPCRGFTENAAWLEVVLTATDLLARTQITAFSGAPVLARCEIAAFRYGVVHVAARIAHSASQSCRRIEKTRRWAPPSPQAGTEYAPTSADHRPPALTTPRTSGAPQRDSRAPTLPPSQISPSGSLTRVQPLDRPTRERPRLAYETGAKCTCAPL